MRGKRFNAFAVEQWLAADGDARDAASLKVKDPSCDRVGCVVSLPQGQSLSIVMDRAAFEEDCDRANVVASPITAPTTCDAPYVFDEAKLAELGTVGLTWRDGRIEMVADRTALTDRPWSPKPRAPREERGIRPSAGKATGADPADPTEEP